MNTTRGDANGTTGADRGSLLVEIVGNEFASVAEEMAIRIWKTGVSPLLKSGDFATAVCDAGGRVVGQGFGAPYQRAQLDALLDFVVQKYGSEELSAGDVLITNDPYSGMGHLPDVAVIAPAFHWGRLIGFCATYSHHSDIGGRFPGGLSDECKSLFEEGLIIPITKVVERHVLNTDFLDLVLANVRTPKEWRGDLEAKISGCLAGTRELAALADKHGVEQLDLVCERTLARSEDRMRIAISSLPDGEYVETDRIVPERPEDEQLVLQLRLTINGDLLAASFEGTSPVAHRGINTPSSMTRAAVYGALHSLLAPDELLNAGLTRSITVDIPEGSLLSPRRPAPVSGRGPIFFRVFDMVYRAVTRLRPAGGLVPGIAGDVLHWTSTDGEEPGVTALDLVFGGWGARTDKDGIDGVAPVFMGTYGTVSIEVLERHYPLQVLGFGFVPDSEGAGTYRGSLAVSRAWKFLRSGQAMVRTTRSADQDGLAGGEAGAEAMTIHIRGAERTRLPSSSHVYLEVEAGDCLYHSTGGAAGYGDPRQRDSMLIMEDVRDGKCSLDHARETYGVTAGADTNDVGAALNGLSDLAEDRVGDTRVGLPQSRSNQETN